MTNWYKLLNKQMIADGKDRGEGCVDHDDDDDDHDHDDNDGDCDDYK